MAENKVSSHERLVTVVIAGIMITLVLEILLF